jgi:hypothetical protein
MVCIINFWKDLGRSTYSLGINQDLPSMHPKHVADLVQIPMFVIAIKYENFGAWIVPAFVGGNPYLTISAAFTAQAERKSGLFRQLHGQGRHGWWETGDRMGVFQQPSKIGV